MPQLSDAGVVNLLWILFFVYRGYVNYKWRKLVCKALDDGDAWRHESRDMGLQIRALYKEENEVLRKALSALIDRSNQQ